jgi:hypothetical protein
MPGFPLVFGVDTFGDLAFDHEGYALTAEATGLSAGAIALHMRYAKPPRAEPYVLT